MSDAFGEMRTRALKVVTTSNVSRWFVAQYPTYKSWSQQLVQANLARYIAYDAVYGQRNLEEICKDYSLSSQQAEKIFQLQFTVSRR